MSEAQPDCKDQAKKDNSVNAERIRALEESAKTIEERIKQLDRAKLVTQDTLRLEFKV